MPSTNAVMLAIQCSQAKSHSLVTVLDVVTATLAITVLKRSRQQHLERG